MKKTTNTAFLDLQVYQHNNYLSINHPIPHTSLIEKLIKLEEKEKQEGEKIKQFSLVSKKKEKTNETI